MRGEITLFKKKNDYQPKPSILQLHDHGKRAFNWENVI